MSSDTIDTILYKYLRQLQAIDRMHPPHMDAVRLALRLALDELAESTPATPTVTSMPGYDALAAQLIQLNNWCANHAPAALNGPGSTADVVLAVLDSYAQQIDRQAEELRQAADPASHDDRIAALKQNLKAVDANNALLRSQLDAMRDAAQSLAEDKRNLQTEFSSLSAQLAQLDADNAALIRRNKELADELHISQNGTGLVVKNPPFVNGNGAAQSPISNLQSSMWDDPEMLKLLDDEATDWWIGCAAGRHAWRTVPKPVQLRMIRHILSFGPETGDMTMREFDAIKPDWMPSSSSHTQTLKLSWQQLNDFRVELEATR